MKRRTKQQLFWDAIGAAFFALFMALAYSLVQAV